jgi:diketogulonate reductase-like aldo/keto reductase
LKAGYRHIDGAWIYRVCWLVSKILQSPLLISALFKNEVEVGKALKESGVPRKDVWITSKVCWYR